MRKGQFEKGNKAGFTSSSDRKLGKNPICFKGYEGQLEQLKSVHNWQERFREFADQLIAQASNPVQND